jgi:arabinan endo-1,5-alpha-L-arabinosidase
MPTALQDIRIRDPFLFTDLSSSTYYLFGATDANAWDGLATGFDCYRSEDLERGSGSVSTARSSSTTLVNRGSCTATSGFRSMTAP